MFPSIQSLNLWMNVVRGEKQRFNDLNFFFLFFFFWQFRERRSFLSLIQQKGKRVIELCVFFQKRTNINKLEAKRESVGKIMTEEKKRSRSYFVLFFFCILYNFILYWFSIHLCGICWYLVHNKMVE